MVSMVKFPSCAGVCVHFKNPDFSYFVAYIAHFRLLVIGYIYRVKREKSARKSERSNVFACDAFHNARIS